jgi:hypothetical protein
MKIVQSKSVHELNSPLGPMMANICPARAAPLIFLRISVLPRVIYTSVKTSVGWPAVGDNDPMESVFLFFGVIMVDSCLSIVTLWLPEDLVSVSDLSIVNAIGNYGNAYFKLNSHIWEAIALDVVPYV